MGTDDDHDDGAGGRGGARPGSVALSPRAAAGQEVGGRDEALTAPVPLPRLSGTGPTAAAGRASAPATAGEATGPIWSGLGPRRFEPAGLFTPTGPWSTPPVLGRPVVPPARWAVPAGPPEPDRVVVGKRWPRWLLPGAGLVACAAGIVGLVLPIDGVPAFSVLGIPGVGPIMLALFVLVTALPVIELWRGTRLTMVLLLPGLVGSLPVAAVVFAVPWLPPALHAVWAAAPATVTGPGAAGPVLGAADLLLVLVGGAAIVQGCEVTVPRRSWGGRRR